MSKQHRESQDRVKYLVLENDEKLDTEIEKFFKKQRITSENAEIKIINPQADHSTVIHAIEDGTKFVVLAPTFFRTSDILKITHDLAHANRQRHEERKFRRSDFRLEGIIIVATFESFDNGMQWVTPDGIACIGGIIDRMKVYLVDEKYKPVELTSKVFFSRVRGILYSTNNLRFDRELYMRKVEKIDHPYIQISSPDKTIHFAIGPTSTERAFSPDEMIADISVANHDELFSKYKLISGEKYKAGYIDVYHGNKRLVIRSFQENNENFHKLFMDLDDIIRWLQSHFDVYYPEYVIQVE